MRRWVGGEASAAGFSLAPPRAILAPMATPPAPRRRALSVRLRTSFVTLAVAALAAGATTGCFGPGRPLRDPTVLIEGDGGRELGVTTDYGILYLGRKNRAGRVAVTAWFGDGPNIEATVVEPVGEGVFTAETEILLPSVPLTFVRPAEGSEVTIFSRRGGREWSATTRVVSDARVRSGVLLQPVSGLTQDELGAPVLVRERDGTWKCLGIVSGRLRLDGPGGAAEYVTVLGPESTWRLVAHRRGIERRRRWTYREDVL